MNELLCIWLCFYLRVYCYRHFSVDKIRIASFLQHQINSVFINTCKFDFLSFVHLLNNFWDLSKGLSTPFYLTGSKAKNAQILIFQVEWIFWGAHLVFALWCELKEPQIMSGWTSSPFLLTCMRLCCAENPTLMQCLLSHRRCHLSTANKFFFF